MGDGFKLIRCEACGADVSKKAGKCPRCGHPVKASGVSAAGCALLVLAVVVMLVGGLFFSGNSGGDPVTGAIRPGGPADRKISNYERTEKYKVPLKGSAPQRWIDGGTIGRTNAEDSAYVDPSIPAARVVELVFHVQTTGYRCVTISYLAQVEPGRYDLICNRRSFRYLLVAGSAGLELLKPDPRGRLLR